MASRSKRTIGWPASTSSSSAASFSKPPPSISTVSRPMWTIISIPSAVSMPKACPPSKSFTSRPETGAMASPLPDGTMATPCPATPVAKTGSETSLKGTASPLIGARMRFANTSSAKTSSRSRPPAAAAEAAGGRAASGACSGTRSLSRRFIRAAIRSDWVPMTTWATLPRLTTPAAPSALRRASFIWSESCTERRRRVMHPSTLPTFSLPPSAASTSSASTSSGSRGRQVEALDEEAEDEVVDREIHQPHAEEQQGPGGVVLAEVEDVVYEPGGETEPDVDIQERRHRQRGAGEDGVDQVQERGDEHERELYGVGDAGEHGSKGRREQDAGGDLGQAGVPDHGEASRREPEHHDREKSGQEQLGV